MQTVEPSKANRSPSRPGSNDTPVSCRTRSAPDQPTISAARKKSRSGSSPRMRGIAEVDVKAARFARPPTTPPHVVAARSLAQAGTLGANCCGPSPSRDTNPPATANAFSEDRIAGWLVAGSDHSGWSERNRRWLVLALAAGATFAHAEEPPPTGSRARAGERGDRTPVAQGERLPCRRRSPPPAVGGAGARDPGHARRSRSPPPGR
jgi:hypothetical protein